MKSFPDLVDVNKEVLEIASALPEDRYHDTTERIIFKLIKFHIERCDTCAHLKPGLISSKSSRFIKNLIAKH